jgi:hypothetical protein
VARIRKHPICIIVIGIESKGLRAFESAPYVEIPCPNLLQLGNHGILLAGTQALPVFYEEREWPVSEGYYMLCYDN